MFWSINKDNFQLQSSTHEKKERLFFHDLINHTHGLLLFMNLRQIQKQDIKADEIEMLSFEIKTLQSLIKDHFGLAHKNLLSTLDWIPFKRAEVSLNGLIQTYLPPSSVSTFIHFNGELSYEKCVSKRESCLIYFPTFYRIMNNLIKNIAESGSSEVNFYFDYGDNGLTIETRNNINNKDRIKALADNLSQVILDESSKNNKFGLESIHHLAIESGGLFEFEVANDVWINRILLPKRSSQVDLLETIDDKNRKKAA